MNEKEFREHYALMQERIQASPQLKAKTLSATAASRAPYTVIPLKTHPAPAKIRRRLVLAVAACLVVAVTAVAAPALIAHTTQPADSTTVPSPLLDFTVRAYAAGTDTLLSMGSDGKIIFDRAGIGGISNRERHLKEGFYTGCLFRIEGEGITRVQAETSKGILYRQTEDEFTLGEDPARAKEAYRWKPTLRGTGEYYADYDNLIVASSFDPGHPDNPDTVLRVQKQKLLGSTLDVTTEADPGIAAGTTSFGLWTNEDYGETASDNPEEPFIKLIDLFDGETLTVSVTFEDGHTSTQVIKLHAADMKAVYESAGNLGGTEMQVVPEIVEDRAQLKEGESVLYSLYGIVTAANKEPFPGDVSCANEFADAVLPPLTLDPLPVVTSAQHYGQKLTLDEEAKLSFGEQAIIPGEDGGAATFSLAFPTIEHSRSMPHVLTLEDLCNAETELADRNRVTEQTYGFRIDEQTGALSKGFSFTTVTMEVTNQSAETQQLFLHSTRMREFGLGEFALVDERGNVAFNTLNETLYFGDGGKNYAYETSGKLSFAPGETKQVVLVKIVPDLVLESPSCLFVVDHSAEAGITQAFDLAIK